jgi:hypothetical protein
MEQENNACRNPGRCRRNQAGHKPAEEASLTGNQLKNDLEWLNAAPKIHRPGNDRPGSAEADARAAASRRFDKWTEAARSSSRTISSLSRWARRKTMRISSSEAEAALKGSEPKSHAADRIAAVGRSRQQRHLPRSSFRRRRHRKPGLGVNMLMRMYTRWAEQHGIQGRASRNPRRRGSGHQVCDAAGQGPQRLWLAEDRIGRAPAGAHLAL